MFTKLKSLLEKNPDWLSADLRNAIIQTNYPTWKLQVQIMPEEEGYKHPWAFDCTKIWPAKDYPLHEIGTIELNRLPMDYFTEVEQVAFSPSNVVNGISFSPDRLLQGRLFLYPDTQLHRLGPHYRQIPINMTHGCMATQYIGGPRNMEYGKNKFPHYFPSCFSGPEAVTPGHGFVQEPPVRCGQEATYYQFEGEGTDEDYFLQPREFVERLSEHAQQNLAINIATSLAKVGSDTLVTSTIETLRKVNDKLATNVQQTREAIITGKSLSEAQKVTMNLTHLLQNNQFEKIQAQD